MTLEIGKRIIDIGPILDIFEAQEGEVHHIIGKTGQGKTYEATRRAFKYLKQGYVVYTTWRLNLPKYYDERESFWVLLKNLLLFKGNFFRFNYQENWHYVNLDDYMEEGIFNTEKFSIFLATRTDCIFFLDEGQDVFDSHTRAGKIARQTITRTRHMHKTLIIVSQRAQAVDVTARGNVTYFFKCEKRLYPFLPPRFVVSYTEEIDETNNYPLWARHDSQGKIIWKAPIWYSGFAKKKIYDLYDSWYMRKQQIRSQDLKIDAFKLNTIDKVKGLFRTIFRKNPKVLNIKHEETKEVKLKIT